MTRRKFTTQFKTKLVLEALKERKTTTELAQKFNVSPQQISTWKREFVDNAELVFKTKRRNKKEETEEQQNELLRVIGQQKVEIDFLKKALT